MIFSLLQLNKMRFPFTRSESLDLNEELSVLPNVSRVNNILIDYTFDRISDNTYRVDMNIDLDIVLECSRTQNDIPYKNHIVAKEIFSTEDLIDAFKIDKQSLDTKEAVLTNIIINIPYNAHLENTDDMFLEDE